MMVGPERERTALEPWEADAFTLIVESSSFGDARRVLSQSVKAVYRPLGIFVVDAFQRQARAMWRVTAGS